MPRLAGLIALVLAIPLSVTPATPAAANGLGPGATDGTAGGAPGFGSTDQRTEQDPPSVPVETKLTATDGAQGDLFGRAVALDGDTALVGAYEVNVDGVQNHGAVYAFTRTDAGWAEQQRLVPNDGQAFGRFGLALALAGDTALVGDESHRGAYVFTRDADGWHEQTKLTRAETGNDYVGTSLALSADGKTAVVAAEGAEVGGATRQGRVHVYTREGDEWTESAQLTASDGHTWGLFGSDVALTADGQTLVVGSEFAHVGDNTYQGQVYVFVREGEAWVERAIMSASDGGSNHRFGNTVAIAGDTILVGAYDAPDGGAAYVFTSDGGTWIERTTLRGSAVGAGSEFARALTLSASGDTAVIGDARANELHGTAYVFAGAEAEWHEETALVASDAEWNHQLGYAVAIDGDTVLAGAWTSRVDGVTNQGSAYLYHFPGSDTGDPAPDPVRCDRTIVGLHAGPLTVDEGVTCLAAGAQVLGEVNVASGAGLVATAAVVQGPVSALGATVVDLSFTQVTGPIVGSGTTRQVSLLGSQVTGSVSLVGSNTEEQPVVVAGNTIIGALTCLGNSPEPSQQGLPNTVTAGAYGQCAGF